jgi:VHL beta domain
MTLRQGTILFFICAAFLTMIVGAQLAHAGATDSGTTSPDTKASAEAKGADATAAFNSAKELGTADAWNAFLASYPTGFHADLARAYLKKLSEGTPAAQTPAASPPPEPTGTARELACDQRKTVRSLKSDVPTKITFVNKSGMYRSLIWIDFDGGTKDYGGLNPDEQLTLETFVTHPWIVATGPGDCLQIFLPDTTPAKVELARLAADDPKPTAKKKAEEPEDEPVRKKKLVCATNYKLQGGKCVLIQNCGKNAYRSPEGDCYCNKNYQMQNGKCVWKIDKQGFEVAPWKKTGCKAWQAQCSQGNAAACAKHESTCQVN